jgi:hypothetical protein
LAVISGSVSNSAVLGFKSLFGVPNMENVRGLAWFDQIGSDRALDFLICRAFYGTPFIAWVGRLRGP